MIERFRESPRWAEIAAAKVVHRELEFLLAWPPAGKGKDNGHSGRYLQGFFDCLYQDASGGWHLVDYKSNDTTVAKVPALADQYEMQMLLYATALERAVGVPPVELVLHFLRPGVEHRFEWNDASRKKCVRMVNDAIRKSDLNDA
jgi:YD repeat-containing protein